MLSFVSYFKDLFKNPVDQVFFLSILLIILIIVLLLIASKIISYVQSKKVGKKIEEDTQVVEEPVQEEAQETEEPVQEEAQEKEEPVQEEAQEKEEPVQEEVKEPKKAAPKKTPAKKTASKKKEAPVPVVSPAGEEKKGRQYNGKFEVYADADGYRYRLKASNGEILVVSETYTTQEGVYKAIENVKKNLETGDVRVFADKRGMFKFKLVSKNYRVLALSANYSTEKGAIRASESFKKFALKADIVEIVLEDNDSSTSTLINIDATDKDGGKFIIEKYNGEFSWDLKASNGQILCQAEGYTSKSGCLYSIENLKKNIETGTFKCVKDKNGSYCYKLYTAQGRICAVGESYPTKQSAESAANSVVSFYKNAEIIEIKEDQAKKTN